MADVVHMKAGLTSTPNIADDYGIPREAPVGSIYRLRHGKPPNRIADQFRLAGYELTSSRKEPGTTGVWVGEWRYNPQAAAPPGEVPEQTQAGALASQVLAGAVLVALVLWFASCMHGAQDGIDYQQCKKVEQTMQHGCS